MTPSHPTPTEAGTPTESDTPEPSAAEGEATGADEAEPVEKREAGGGASAVVEAAGRAVRVRELRADEVAALEEQRDFLLRSLDDLEQEHDAGDVDEHDYLALRDDYTARAARVIRALEAHQARVAPRVRRSRWRTLVTVAGVVLFALGAGVLVAQAAGRRQSGDSVTGDIRESTRRQIDVAIGVASQGDFASAIDQLDAVLEDDPDNVEALTYKGWFQYRSGDGESVSTLIDATEVDPDYPATHAFLAVILRDLGRPDYAMRELDRLDELDPPAEIAEMVAPLREQLEADLAQSTETTEPAG
jgi:tetratricopeptide (TPR) repeat protein